MYIKSIKLENFRTHNKFYKEFTNRINVIAGDNGSGKSSLFKAIEYVIYGESEDSTLAESVKRGEKKCSVTIALKYKGINYVFNRETTLNKKGKGTSTASIELDNHDPIKGSSEVNSYVESHFPYKSLLFSSNYAMQDSNDGFMTYKPAERFKEFLKIRNCTKWIKRGEKCDELSKVIDSEVLVLDTKVNTVKEELSGLRVIPIEVTVDHFKKLIIEKDSTISSLETKKSDIEKSVADIDEKNKAYNDKTIEKQNLTTDLTRFDSEKVDLDSYINTTYASIVNELKKDQDSLNEELNGIRLTRLPVLDKDSFSKATELSNESKFNIRKLEDKLRSIESGECPTCQATYSSENLDSLNVEIQKAKKEGEVLQEKVDSFHEVERKINEITLSNSKHSSRKSEIETILENKNNLIVKEDEVKRTKEGVLNTVEASLVSCKQRVDLLTEELSSMEIIDKQSYTSKLEKLMSEIFVEKQQRDNLVKDKAELEMNIKTNEETKKRKEEIEKLITSLELDIENKKIKQDRYNNLKKLFSKTIPMFIILDSLKKVQVTVNKFLLDVYPKNSIKFIEDNQKLLIKLSERNSDLPAFEFTTLSGFEKTITKLSTRLGLSSLIGGEVESVILDEFDANANDKNSEKTIKSVMGLTRSFKQIFITTHKPQIKSYLESLGAEIVDITQ